MTTPRKHAELIKAWADGATIEIRNREGWEIAVCPRWFEANDYRIQPGPDRYRFRVGYFRYSDGTPYCATAINPNDELVFSADYQFIRWLTDTTEGTV